MVYVVPDSKTVNDVIVKFRQARIRQVSMLSGWAKGAGMLAATVLFVTVARDISIPFLFMGVFVLIDRVVHMTGIFSHGKAE